jgi:hypothetical protein
MQVYEDSGSITPLVLSLDGRRWKVALYPRKELTLVRYEAERAPEMIWKFRRSGNSFAPPGNRNLRRPARSLITTHVPTTKWHTKLYYKPNNLLATRGKILFSCFSYMLVYKHAHMRKHTYELFFIADQREAALSLKKPPSAGISCDSCRVRDSDKRYERAWVLICWQVSCKDKLCSTRVRNSSQYTIVILKLFIHFKSLPNVDHYALYFAACLRLLLRQWLPVWS